MQCNEDHNAISFLKQGHLWHCNGDVFMTFNQGMNHVKHGIL